MAVQTTMAGRPSLGWPRAGDPSGRHRIGQAADGAEEEQVEVGESDEGERAAVLPAADAADAEREVDGEADQDRQGDPRAAAGARGGLDLAVAIGGIGGGHRGYRRRRGALGFRLPTLEPRSRVSHRESGLPAERTFSRRMNLVGP